VSQRPAFGDGIGGMTIAGGIAAALYRRERTGEPAVIDISLLATAMWTLAPDITMARALAGLAGRMPKFDRRMSPNPIVNAFRTRDGRWIMLIMLQSDRDWPDLCRHLGRPDLIDDSRFCDAAKRFENRGECVDVLDAIFSQRSLDEWKQALATTQGVWAPVQRPIELYDDPQVLANDYLPEVLLGDGTRCQLVNSPVQFDEHPAELRHAPECGQDTEQVLLELGVDWEAIAAYKKSGAIV
jgi:crotonobetainyl-CoA:carnitine CoA-transferase CaiB-like acyl-CoA transferase